MSNRELLLKELSLLRRKAVEVVLKEGLTQAKSAKLFGFTKASMSKYIKAYKLNGEANFVYRRRGVKRSKPRYLTEEQCKNLVAILLTKTPDEVGLEYTLWNSLGHVFISD
jgi:transposase